jgi:plasmid stabilization system protein ParE
MRSSTLIHAYQRTRFLRNVMLVAFGAMLAVTLLWVIPWVPWGLTEEDYNSEAVVAVTFGFGAWIAAFGFVYLRDQANRYEQTIVTWSSVHDELGDLRRREYLYERTVIECMRAERTGVSFGVFAIHFGIGENVNSAQTATALEALAGLIRQTDSLAALGPQEVGVIGAAMGNREAPGFAYRLKSTIEMATGSQNSDLVSVGWAIWGTDGADADALFGLARSRMQHKTFLREWAHEVDGQEEAEDTFNALEAEVEPSAGDETSSPTDRDDINDDRRKGSKRLRVLGQRAVEPRDEDVA